MTSPAASKVPACSYSLFMFPVIEYLSEIIKVHNDL